MQEVREREIPLPVQNRSLCSHLSKKPSSYDGRGSPWTKSMRIDLSLCTANSMSLSPASQLPGAKASRSMINICPGWRTRRSPTRVMTSLLYVVQPPVYDWCMPVIQSVIILPPFADINVPLLAWPPSCLPATARRARGRQRPHRLRHWYAGRWPVVSSGVTRRRWTGIAELEVEVAVWVLEDVNEIDLVADEVGRRRVLVGGPGWKIKLPVLGQQKEL